MLEIHGSRWRKGALLRLLDHGQTDHSPVGPGPGHSYTCGHEGHASRATGKAPCDRALVSNLRTFLQKKDQEDGRSGSPSVANPATRHTEADGWLASWRHDRGQIRILQVRLASGAPLELSTGTHIPDLVDMRERFPEHSALWDAIRHEFWAALVPESHTG